MKRELVNKIRFFLEEIIPPIIRDSFFVKFLIKKTFRSDKMHFALKENFLNLTNKQIINYYKINPNLQGETDLSKKILKKILKEIDGEKILDAGCGRFFLLKEIRKIFPKKKLYGIDFQVNKNYLPLKIENIKIFEQDLKKILFSDKYFDTVICTHTLEHILEPKKVYDELLRICKKKIIIVVPRERPYKYTFNGHLHFFPYKYSFINTIIPKNKFVIQDLNRDFLYIEYLKNND
jgi:ubiquinone/menaquinone biosynthesis C-methylase UbiE